MTLIFMQFDQKNVQKFGSVLKFLMGINFHANCWISFLLIQIEICNCGILYFDSRYIRNFIDGHLLRY